MNARIRFLVVGALLAAVAACADKVTGPAKSLEPDRIAVTLTGLTRMASVGDSLRVAVEVLDAAAGRVDGRALVWSVEPAGVVQDLGDGIFRAVGNGTARIIVALRDGVPVVRPSGYSVRQIADTIEVQVAQVATQLTVASVDTALWSIGASRRVGTTLADARGNIVPDSVARPVWTSSDSSTVRVDASGLVTAVRDGSATLRATYGTLERTVRFGVSAAVPLRRCATVTVAGAPVERCSTTLQLVVTERTGGAQ